MGCSVQLSVRGVHIIALCMPSQAGTAAFFRTGLGY